VAGAEGGGGRDDLEDRGRLACLLERGRTARRRACARVGDGGPHLARGEVEEHDAAPLGPKRLQRGRAEVEVRAQAYAPLARGLRGGEGGGGDHVGGRARLGAERAGGIEEPGQGTATIGDGHGRARAVRLEHAREALAQAGRGGESGELRQQRRRRTIVAALDESSRFVGGRAGVPALAREPGQAQRRVERAAAERRVHERARPIGREVGRGEVDARGTSVQGAGQGQAGTRATADATGVAMSVQECPCLGRARFDQQLRGLSEIGVGPSARDEEEGGRGDGRGKRPPERADQHAPRAALRLGIGPH
jgi:hypothetical protein